MPFTNNQHTQSSTTQLLLQYVWESPTGRPAVPLRAGRLLPAEGPLRLCVQVIPSYGQSLRGPPRLPLSISAAQPELTKSESSTKDGAVVVVLQA
jgi:hypothetical protein